RLVPVNATGPPAAARPTSTPPAYSATTASADADAVSRVSVAALVIPSWELVPVSDPGANRSGSGKAGRVVSSTKLSWTVGEALPNSLRALTRTCTGPSASGLPATTSSTDRVRVNRPPESAPRVGTNGPPLTL